jgi:hypothetical protein
MRWSVLAFGEEGNAPIIDLEPGKILWGTALALLLLSALRRPNAKAFRLDTPLKMLLAFVALAVASLMWSYDFGFALTWVIRLYMPVLIYVMVSSYTRTLRDVRAWTYTFVIVGFGAFVFVFYETLFVVGIIGAFIHNSIGGTQFFNEYCQWATIAFAFGAYFALYPRKPWELVMGIASMLCAMGTIYITFRRTAGHIDGHQPVLRPALGHYSLRGWTRGHRGVWGARGRRGRGAGAAAHRRAADRE